MINNKGERQQQRVVAYVCAILFAVFSFLFVAKYQSPVLEAFYSHVATGKLNYSGVVLGLSMSLPLTLLSLWVNRLAKFRREWTAMAYLPSAMLLALFTDIDRSMYIGGWSLWKWVLIFLLAIALYAGMAVLLRRLPADKTKDSATAPGRIIWRNLVILLVMFLLAGTLSSGEENFKREALAVSYYKKGETGKALKVGYKSLDSSRELTAIRSFLLAGNGLLGEHLFEYPQYYSSEGLLLPVQQTSPLHPDTLFALIGDKPSEGESAAGFLNRLSKRDSLPAVVKEYYLSSLLLERRLPLFETELRRLHPSTPADSLPKHYREALVILSALDSSYSVTLQSDTLFMQFDSLRRIENRYDDALVRSNYVRKSFGRTYWWYFLYGY